MKPNISRLSLKSLRDHLNATTLDVLLPDDDGDVHAMVFVPRFTVPADLIAPGVPSRDLDLGGFLVDKYPAAELSYVGGVTKAVSRPLGALSVIPENAAEAAARRTFQGSPVTVMSLREWGHLAWLVRLLGHVLKGNTQARRDARDPDAWASYADQFGVLGAPLSVPGSGPSSWFHNGLPSGIADLLGNLMHYLEADGAAPGALLVVREAVLSQPGGVNDAETDFQISNPLHSYSGWYSFANWPAANGLLRIGDELVVYGALAIDEVDASIAHLTNCTRGQYSTGASVHAEDATAQLERWHVVAPGSYLAKLNAYIADDSPYLVLDWNVYGHGERDANPAIGDVLCIGTEDLLVTDFAGTTLTVTRGHNGTTPAAHDAGSLVARYPDGMTRGSQGYVSGFAEGPLRDHVDLEHLYLPSECRVTPPAYVAPFVQFQLSDASGHYVLRGASNQRAAAENQLALQLLGDDAAPIGHQWRCVRYV